MSTTAAELPALAATLDACVRPPAPSSARRGCPPAPPVDAPGLHGRRSPPRSKPPPEAASASAAASLPHNGTHGGCILVQPVVLPD